MSKKVYVDQDACIGCGACVAIAGDFGIFDFNDQNKAYVVKQPTSESEFEAAEDGKSACPVDAIKIQ
ncbi:ferredoxin [Candidatus Absconditicoccus praedator]|uniref:ferredoxin n=1 Tax=Candidatus Absconditicoccus praedator TaxID=2735562 RepID=UPI001E2CF46F|nr:ferredoxin [Candidatus Absconditicoccus praedator]UFX83214.1 ferredoxin [Candidatus Absconditicoccus praedator]